MAVSTPGASIPIGVYRGRGCGISAIGVYEDFIGRQVQKVVDFMAEKPASWAQFENGNLTSTADVSAWQGVLRQRQLALGVPACCGASAGSVAPVSPTQRQCCASSAAPRSTANGCACSSCTHR